MDTYTQRGNIKLQAEQWNGWNLTGITSLAGAGNVNMAGAFLQVRVSDNRWENVHLHWWVSRDEYGQLTVHSDNAFRRDWRKTDD